MTTSRWQSPLSGRYASPAMLERWSEAHRIGQWRRVWLALAESQQAMGIEIPEAALEELRAHLDDADLAAAADFERRFRHDVMAHVHALGEQAPAVRPYLHLGATSAFVTDNADGMIIRGSLALVLGRLLEVLTALRAFAHRNAALPCLAYTHFQPAQLTTVGKRATLWMQDLALDVEALVHRLETFRLRGCKGTTGTQASFLELFGGDHDKVRELERQVARRLGHDHVIPVSGQTYSRKLDSQVLDVLSGIAQSAAKFAADIRLLQHEGELLEPFESEQIGSSAMAYKRNPMRSERIGALARHVITLQQNTAHTAAAQWLERTLDDSANRRLTLPEAFLATDAILLLMHNIASGIEVREMVIGRHVQEQMPFMATERWLMLGVQAGGDRQALHEVVRGHSLAVSEAVAVGAGNDLLDRLAADPAFGAVDRARLVAELEPSRYVGRSPEQVTEFLAEYLDPLVARARPLAETVAAAEIRV
ncbi:MAG: adenylosuccinate lyase [Gemmatimonadales bacterium]|nr:adenylosuccinate lyase [Gemmatimonadales bacterium]